MQAERLLSQHAEQGAILTHSRTLRFCIGTVESLLSLHDDLSYWRAQRAAVAALQTHPVLSPQWASAAVAAAARVQQQRALGHQPGPHPQQLVLAGLASLLLGDGPGVDAFPRARPAEGMEQQLRQGQERQALLGELLSCDAAQWLHDRLLAAEAQPHVRDTLRRLLNSTISAQVRLSQSKTPASSFGRVLVQDKQTLAPLKGHQPMPKHEIN